MKTTRRLVLTVWLAGIALPVHTLEIVQKTTAETEFRNVEAVLFFTTNCPSCRAHLPTWNALVARADAEKLDVSFRAVSGEMPQDIEIFLEDHPIAGEVVGDPSIDLARAYGLRRLPIVAVVRAGRGVELLRPEALTIERIRFYAGEAAAEPPPSISHRHGEKRSTPPSPHQ